MSKSAKTAKISRSASTGQFLGRAKDGTWIARPDFKPKSFTVRELRRAVREVQRREAEAKAS